LSQSRSSIHPSLLVGLVAVLGILVWLNGAESGDSTGIPVRLALQETIYVTALALNAEVEATGSLPPDLEAIGMDKEGLYYQVTGEGYNLTAQEGDVTVEYHQGENLEPFQKAFEELLPPFRAGR
jgi:multidrug efflux pump subunit AcrA (membrane-fusion protein)